MDGRKNNGGPRKGSGRKERETTESTGFRVHKESLDICRAAKVPVNAEVNKLIRRLAKKVLKGKRGVLKNWLKRR
jgi:hypothetical protein